jgi:membrane protein required for colicin V production
VTGFDFVVLALVLASVLVSLLRGLIREALSLIAFALAVVAALWWGPSVQLALTPYLETDLLRIAVGYTAVFIGVLLGVGLINLALITLVRATGLAPLDRGLGALYGLVRGLLIVMLLVLVAGYTPMPAQPWWQTAMLSPLAERGAIEIKLRLPPDVAQWVPYPYEGVPAQPAVPGVLPALPVLPAIPAVPVSPPSI